MTCMKCESRVFFDRIYSDPNRAELFCMGCGKRWMIKKDNPFAAWLLKLNEAFEKATAVV